MGVSGIMIARQVPVFPFAPELWCFKSEKTKQKKRIKKIPKQTQIGKILFVMLGASCWNGKGDLKQSWLGNQCWGVSQIFRSIRDGNNNPFFFFLFAAEGHSSNPGFSRKSRSRDTGISPPARDLTSSRTSPTTASSTGGRILREWRKPGNSCWNGSPSCAGNSAQPGGSLNNN